MESPFWGFVGDNASTALKIRQHCDEYTYRIPNPKHMPKYTKAKDTAYPR